MARQFITFYIGEEWLGVDILLVTEVCHGVTPTPVDLCPDYVFGLMNLRGKIITVLDLACKLGLAGRSITPASRIIVLKSNAELARQNIHATLSNDPVGLLVDRVGDVLVVEEEHELEEAPAHLAGLDGYFVDRVVRVEHALMTVLRLPEVLVVTGEEPPTDVETDLNAGMDDKEAHSE
ncbi:MAG: chemotaxis protein CheW [Kiritimatiellae bacterium]|nr:chemotaxis protein CheW [Kiritimatiellia bacterium]